MISDFFVIRARLVGPPLCEFGPQNLASAGRVLHEL